MAPDSQTIRLIVNADDFGLTKGVNRGIEELSSGGALSSATLMANSSAFDDAVRLAKQRPDLGVGCHVVLVDGAPCSPPASIPTLLGKNGRLRDSLAGFWIDLQRKHISEAEIEIEAGAQIARLQAAGLRVTHVDTHKHTHIFPRVARPLMRAAMRLGVTAIRNPFEQSWSARLTRGALIRKIEVASLRGFLASYQQMLRASGMKSTDGSIGVSATGKLDAATLARLLREAPGGTWELVCHPGYRDVDLDAIRTRLRGTRDVEREALMRLIPEAVRSGRIQLITFAEI